MTLIALIHFHIIGRLRKKYAEAAYLGNGLENQQISWTMT